MNTKASGSRVVQLAEIAHAHAGDKGSRSNISIIPYDSEDYELLLAELTEARVFDHFRYRNPAAVRRYRLDNLPAINFVIDGLLEGGVNRSLGLDGHGQALSFHLLTLELVVPEKP